MSSSYVSAEADARVPVAFFPRPLDEQLHPPLTDGGLYLDATYTAVVEDTTNKPYVPYMAWRPAQFYQMVKDAVGSRNWAQLSRFIQQLPVQIGSYDTQRSDQPDAHARWHEMHGHVVPGLIDALIAYFSQQYAAVEPDQPFHYTSAFVFGDIVLSRVFEFTESELAPAMRTIVDMRDYRRTGMTSTILFFNKPIGLLSQVMAEQNSTYVARRGGSRAEIFTCAPSRSSHFLRFVFAHGISPENDMVTQTVTAYSIMPDYVTHINMGKIINRVLNHWRRSGNVPPQMYQQLVKAINDNEEVYTADQVYAIISCENPVHISSDWNSSASDERNTRSHRRAYDSFSSSDDLGSSADSTNSTFSSTSGLGWSNQSADTSSANIPLPPRKTRSRNYGTAGSPL